MSSGLGQRIRNARTAKGLTLRAVARESGISPARLSNLENSPQANPTISTLERIANTLGTTAAELIADQEAPPNAAH